MEVILDKKPKSPIIIEGFPGFGFVGTIVTEFLIDHLNAKLIGKLHCKDLLPIAAVHFGKVVEPLGIFHDSKNNLVIVHALNNVNTLEWEIADILCKLCNDLKAKELISVEGIGSTSPNNTKVYTYSNKPNKKLEDLKLDKLKEGIIMGVTGALLLKFKNAGCAFNCFFAEVHSALPDSRAAAEIIKALDNYLGLKVDYKPLLSKAEKFEEQLKNIMEQAKGASEQKKKKELSYVG